jgi:TolB protein
MASSRSAGGESDITVGCYLYDTALKSELERKGYVVAPRDWRRAAHKCADAIYARLSGESPFFDSRIAYIAESGPKDRRVKRLAIMDSDGANHRFITNGQAIALSPPLLARLWLAALCELYSGARPDLRL